MRFKHSISVLFFFLFVFLANALFEDQIGKFDWSARHLGCFHQTIFDVTDFSNEILIAASEKNAIGKINTNTGELEWRQLNEQSFQHNPEILVKDSKVITMFNNGEYFRAFDLDSGELKWQYLLSLNSTSATKFSFFSKFLAVLSDSKVYGFVESNKKFLKWTTNIDKDSYWLDVVINNNGIFIIGALKNGKEIRILLLHPKTGHIENMKRLSIVDASFSFDLCSLFGNYLVCSTGSTVFTINVVSNDELKRVDTDFKNTILKVCSFVNSESAHYFVAQSSESTIVCEIQSDGRIRQILKLDRSNIFTFAKNIVRNKINTNTDSHTLLKSETHDNYLFAIYYESQHILKIYNLHDKIFLANLKISSAPGDAPIKSIHLVGTTESETFQVLSTRRDCRVDFFEAHLIFSEDVSVKNVYTANMVLEWVRFEALASISCVKMIDLPLSAAQVRIETEFGAVNEPVWRSFFLRVSSQLEQFRQYFVFLSNRFVESLGLITSKRSGATFTTVFRHFFGYDISSTRRYRPATIFLKNDFQNNANLERDYFNLRKLIIVSTLSGSLYALSNDGGEVIWTMYLGDDFLPFYNELGKATIPIFIQRGTTLFQQASQASVVINSNRSKKSSVIVFNPVTGAYVNTLYYDNLKRVELLPFENAESLSLLLLINDQENVQFYPEISSTYRPPYPVYVFFLESKGIMRGAFVDFASKKLVAMWRSNLGFFSDQEKILQIEAKSINQKVHSQGKVLGNRSVLYKYANPNLIAIASVDELHSLLSIWLVDGVSGQIVHSARHPHSQSPVNLVHCENWLVYTYWNDKARRTELGIIELYEGLTQTNENYFNSLTGLQNPLTVFTQSYIFSQGISSIASSETEQGLSTRSLIISMPFGGVLEISRRFIDARRPLEMTPEIREEMIIPYMPELPVATEDLINYNQTVYNVQGIKTSASGLESTSLVFVYGLDVFYTRVTPSGTFDILKDDFDYVLISLVMVVLIGASFLSKRLWRHHSLKQAWS